MYTSFARTPDNWYLARDGNADDVVHSPSFPSESPVTTSGDESEHKAVIAASAAPPPPRSPPAGRRNHFTGGVPLSPALSRNPNAPFSHEWLNEDLGIGMEVEAIDPSEYPTAIFDEFEALPATTGAKEPGLCDTTDFVIGACWFPLDTGHRAKHVASPPVVVANRGFLLPSLLPIPGGVNRSRDASWVAIHDDAVRIDAV